MKIQWKNTTFGKRSSCYGDKPLNVLMEKRRVLNTVEYNSENIIIKATDNMENKKDMKIESYDEAIHKYLMSFPLASLEDVTMKNELKKGHRKIMF